MGLVYAMVMNIFVAWNAVALSAQRAITRLFVHNTIVMYLYYNVHRVCWMHKIL